MQTISVTFEDVGRSPWLSVKPGESFTYSVDLGETFDGVIKLQRTTTAGQTWEDVATIGEDVESATVLDSPGGHYAFICLLGDEETITGTADVTLSEVEDVIYVQKKGGADIFTVTENGVLTVLGKRTLNTDDLPNLIPYHTTEESITTNDTTAEAVSLAVYHSKITSSGSEGAEDLEIGDGTGAVIGQRKLITLETRTHASDSIALDDDNISQGSDTITGVALDAAGEFILLEFRGVKWEVIAASGGVVTTGE